MATAKQIRRKLNKLYKDIIVAHSYATTTPKHGDDPWETLKAIEEILRHKKRIVKEIRLFCMTSNLSKKAPRRKKD